MGNVVKKESFAARLTALKIHDEKQPRLEDLAKIAAGKGVPVSVPAVAKWLKGTGTPGPDSIQRLAAYFGVTKEWLYFGDSPKQPISIDVAKGLDLLPEDDRREIARDVSRRLDGAKDIRMGGDHDSFVSKISAAAEKLKDHAKSRQ